MLAGGGGGGSCGVSDPRIIKEGKVRTYGMGGKASTLDVAKEVAKYAT